MSYFDHLFMENSKVRLIELINARGEPGANRAEIDRRIWDLFGEDWTVMFTDLSGFSRHAAKFGIIHFIQIIIQSEQLFAPVLERHGGFIIKQEGDSLMIVFRNPVEAIHCALEMQEACQRFSLTVPDEEKVILCLGLSHGKILRIGSDDVFGEAVNSASKLGEDTADQHEILVTKEFLEACGDDFPKPVEPIDFIPPGSKAAFKTIYDIYRG